MDIRWLGHAAFELKHGGVTVLVDPFITGNPVATVEPDALEADAILLTHGHADHFGDVVSIAKRTGATVQAITEIAEELSGDVEVIDTNLGGTASYDWGSVRLVPAWHTSDLALPGRRKQIDIEVVCIGGHYTMDREDAVVAAGLIGASA